MSSLRSDASVRAPEFVEPAFFTRPDFTDSIGEEVADFAAACGFPPDPEQRMVLSAMFAGPAGVSYRTRDRKWYSSQVAVICSRQNLKTACMEMGVLGALWLLDARLVLWTSHIFNPAAAETFFHFKQLIDENAHLSRRVKRIHDASGRESIELMNGARLKFLARSKATGRALSGDLVILDEAYALSTAEVGALLPTRSARPNSQVWYGSSAGRIESEQLRLIRDRGREGADRMTYVEWCSTKSCASDRCTHNVGEIGWVLDDHDEWRKANPALGRRIDIETVQDERISMSPQEFARERLGWWDGAGAGRVIPIGRWAANASSGGIVGDVAVFVDVTIDLDCVLGLPTARAPYAPPQNASDGSHEHHHSVRANHHRRPVPRRDLARAIDDARQPKFERRARQPVQRSSFDLRRRSQPSAGAGPERRHDHTGLVRTDGDQSHAADHREEEGAKISIRDQDDDT